MFTSKDLQFNNSPKIEGIKDILKKNNDTTYINPMNLSKSDNKKVEVLSGEVKDIPFEVFENIALSLFKKDTNVK